MLTQLSIRDVVLIEKLDLSFGAGLTVLTGETGAGKSILLDSLGLALGERAQGSIVREGAKQCSVTALFDVPADHPALAVLSELGLIPPPRGEPLVLRRTVSAEGRSRAWAGEQPIGITALKQLGKLLVEIQGQHEQMGLADPAGHLDVLDAFGQLSKENALVSTRWHSHRKALKALNQARSALEEAAREEEWLRDTVTDLETLAPVEGEEDALAARRVHLQAEERRAEAVAAALAELAPSGRRSNVPAAAVRAATRALYRLVPPGDVLAPPPGPSDESSPAFETPTTPEDHTMLEEERQHQALLQEAMEALERAELALSDAEASLSRLEAESLVDTRALEETEGRLFTLRAEARKHNIPVVELPSFLATLKVRLEALDRGNAGLIELEGQAKAARDALMEAARTLSKARGKAAARLEKAVMAELAPLKLGRAIFSAGLTSLEEGQVSERGLETAGFLIAANPGQKPQPLGRVASGGELSRLMLALKVVLAHSSPLATLIFDEVDSGVGGATASAIGSRLHRIARDLQVFAITHSPQIAALADHHIRIEKRIGQTAGGARTHTHAMALPPQERREEIARMLAGSEITDAARAAADSLMEQRPS
ncbi:DNA repair protein RecN [Formicincola oecophyllae]|uniref:DNA repair protein RecN n=1 Tax=Formicincola oecophyllae TaxID=2558361 RepID=A0A4Y6U987_9PROT|nr:DNA repair protein RecN [Formicincola oecophyllae]QDH13016.1 DNA repair protein RecN [Formicincola oecophyllae]